MNAEPQIVRSLTKLTVIHPDGSYHLIGWIFQHSNPILNALIGAPLTWHRDFMTARHNAMIAKLDRARIG
jgi:hypothetical protein